LLKKRCPADTRTRPDRTSWGIKGKDLYLLHVLRKRMEYPELKRAVREQCQAFEASVVLIEDKACGTTPRWYAPGRTTNPRGRTRGDEGGCRYMWR
jgi:hypothetical protein